MNSSQGSASSQAAEAIRTFLATYDACDASDRQVVTHVRQQLHRELYRRERELYPEWIDLGGEA